LAQDLNKQLTYSTVAVPTARAVEEIAKFSGAKLEVSPSQNRDVLVIKVKDVTVRQLMDQIAVATSGEWKEDNGVWRLSRDTAKQGAEERKELVDKTNKVRAAIKKLVEQLKPGKKQTSADGEPVTISAAQAMMGGSGAGGKAIIDMLARIDPSLIAGLDKDGRLVFATNPTRMQRPLQIDSASITQLIQDHNREAEAAKKMESDAPKTPEQEQAEEWAAKFMPGMMHRREPITAAPAKILLVITRVGLLMGTSATLRLFDAKGQVVFEATQPIPLGDDMISEMTSGEVSIDASGQVVEKPKSDPTDDGPEIKLSPIAQEMSTMFARYYGQGADEPKLSPEVAERLRHPEKWDPLSYDVSESILAVAENKNLNVVANVPDGLAGNFVTMFTGSKKRTIGSFFKQLQDGSETVATVADGWLIVRPAAPPEARRMRVSRAALATLITASAGKEVPALDDLAAYALEAEDPQSTPIVLPYIANFAANALQGGMMGMLNWDMLRLYGTLGAPQRQSLTAGGKIAFSALAPNQTEIVRRMAFGASANLHVDRPTKKPKDEEDVWGSLMPFMQMGQSEDFRDEPTEVMPNGLPNDGYLDLKASPDSFVLVVGQKGATVKQYGAMGSDELAMLKYFSEDPNFQQFSSQIPRFERFRLGERTTLDFKFHLAPDVRLEHILRDDRLAKDSPVVGEEGFPPSLKARIEKRIAGLKKNPFPFPMGLGQAVPPP
jgi:hypothetical protein